MERHRTDTGTWEEFAGAVGVTRTALMAWFAGREPSLSRLRGLASVLGVARWELVKEWDGN